MAGSVEDRVFVGGPAWHALGPEAWLQLSRHADLGTGLIVYPIEGIGSTLLITAAAVSTFVDGTRRLRKTFALYCAVAFSVAGLLLTVKAPIMLNLSKSQSTASIQTAFDEFLTWGLYFRGSADILAFVALVWALAETYRADAQPAKRHVTSQNFQE
ncbi:MAG: hypothetical protein J2P54_13655 [Bradyrhizobiaceae bacterium]|nr:hypothetical protein [Bradyrhizobiaceae bacterium]